MDALWKAIEMEKAKSRDPSLSKIERAETLRVSCAPSKCNAAVSDQTDPPRRALVSKFGPGLHLGRIPILGSTAYPPLLVAPIELKHATLAQH
jgi:hypothetical protein